MSDYLDQKVVKSIVVNSNKLELSGDSAAPGASNIIDAKVKEFGRN